MKVKPSLFLRAQYKIFIALVVSPSWDAPSLIRVLYLSPLNYFCSLYYVNIAILLSYRCRNSFCITLWDPIILFILFKYAFCSLVSISLLICTLDTSCYCHIEYYISCNMGQQIIIELYKFIYKSLLHNCPWTSSLPASIPVNGLAAPESKIIAKKNYLLLQGV